MDVGGWHLLAGKLSSPLSERSCRFISSPKRRVDGIEHAKCCGSGVPEPCVHCHLLHYTSPLGAGERASASLIRALSRGRGERSRRESSLSPQNAAVCDRPLAPIRAPAPLLLRGHMALADGIPVSRCLAPYTRVEHVTHQAFLQSSSITVAAGTRVLREVD